MRIKSFLVWGFLVISWMRAAHGTVHRGKIFESVLCRKCANGITYRKEMESCFGIRRLFQQNSQVGSSKVAHSHHGSFGKSLQLFVELMLVFRSVNGRAILSTVAHRGLFGVENMTRSAWPIRKLVCQYLRTVSTSLSLLSVCYNINIEMSKLLAFEKAQSSVACSKRLHSF